MPHYSPEVLEALAAHGLRPKLETPSQLVKEHVNDLYRHELRSLRARLVRGDILKAGYSRHVVELRKRYFLLSIPLQFWTR